MISHQAHVYWSDGRTEDAKRSAESAKMWIIVTVLFGVVMFISSIIVYSSFFLYREI